LVPPLPRKVESVEARDVPSSPFFFSGRKNFSLVLLLPLSHRAFFTHQLFKHQQTHPKIHPTPLLAQTPQPNPHPRSRKPHPLPLLSSVCCLASHPPFCHFPPVAVRVIPSLLFATPILSQGISFTRLLSCRRGPLFFPTPQSDSFDKGPVFFLDKEFLPRPSFIEHRVFFFGVNP